MSFWVLRLYTCVFIRSFWTFFPRFADFSSEVPFDHLRIYETAPVVCFCSAAQKVFRRRETTEKSSPPHRDIDKSSPINGEPSLSLSPLWMCSPHLFCWAHYVSYGAKEDRCCAPPGSRCGSSLISGCRPRRLVKPVDSWTKTQAIPMQWRDAPHFEKEARIIQTSNNKF